MNFGYKPRTKYAINSVAKPRNSAVIQMITVF